MTTAASPSSPPSSVSPIVAPLKRGAVTSEGVLSLIVTLLTAAAADPWVSTMPPLYKAISGALAVITVVFYQAQRTSLKRTHAMLAAGVHPIASNAVAGIAIKAAALSCVLVVMIGVSASSCSGTSTLSQVGSAAGSAGLAGLECEGVNLEGIVGVGSDGKNISLLEQVGEDVLSANYVTAIADLVKGFGSITIGCAVLAADDLESGLASLDSAGSGSAALATNATTARAKDSAAISLERLRTLETAYGWKRAPRKTLQRSK